MEDFRIGIPALLTAICLGAIAWNTATAVEISPPGERNGLTTEIKEASVRKAMTKVASWQMKQHIRENPRDWVWGSYLTGMTEWAKLSRNKKFLNYVIRRSRENDWKPYKLIYHADGHIIGATYMELHSLYNKEEMLKPLRERFNYILGHRSRTSLKFNRGPALTRWCWCDAIFMAPPVWTQLAVKTGDYRFLQFMDEEFKTTTDYLWDDSEDLYFRDSTYFNKKEANGEKVFWSRGNGWVMAGLARMLRHIPKDHKTRTKYEEIFKKMAAKIASLQQPDGTWHASLLDPKSYPSPEISGTGFYTFALVWGINNGLLEREKYLPVVKKAWTAMVKSVYPNGKLGWIQPIGQDPKKVRRSMTQIYGTGAFLLTGCELLRLIENEDKTGTIVTVTNTAKGERFAYTAEVDWQKLKATNTELATLSDKDLLAGKAMLTVKDLDVLKPIEYQAVDHNNDGKVEKIIFQTHLYGKQTKRFRFVKRTSKLRKKQISDASFGRHVPERKDDFAWENNRIAFRIYGSALEKAGERGSGIDVWCKRISKPVINRWYKKADYHKDHGEGGDFYKVGPTRGCGGISYFVDSKEFTSGNWTKYRMLENGPIRVMFELEYAPVSLPNGEVLTETKRISLAKDSNLCKITSIFKPANKGDSLVATKIGVGLVLRNGEGEVAYGVNKSWMSYSEPTTQNGKISVGVVLPEPQSKGATFSESANHIWLKFDRPQTLTYYAGACWDRSNNIKTRNEWEAYLKHFASTVNSQVKIEIK